VIQRLAEPDMMPARNRFVLRCLVLLLLSGVVAAQDSPPIRLRGAVQEFADPNVVILERDGKVITLVVPNETGIVEVIPTDIALVQPGTYIGTATVPRADGKLVSLEVVVFPEFARGTGEGHFPWDLEPESSMTNATVAELARSSDGRTLKLRYKDGEKTVIVPDGVPVVTLRPGNRLMIVPGAKLFAVAEKRGDQYIVMRLLVGRSGLQPPM
jgi:hypothetical protein